MSLSFLSSADSSGLFNQMYAKVFAQIFDSSIANDYCLRHFFMDLLVLAESDGVVDMTNEAIAARTRIPVKLVNSMLLELEKPDPQSRTRECEGRRIVRLDLHRDWGWRIVNYASYRDIRDEKERKVYMRNYMRQYRKRPAQPCAYCGTPAEGEDHIIALSQGGLDDPSNIVPCCFTCNASKKHFTLARWFFESDTVMSNRRLEIAVRNEKVYRIFKETLEASNNQVYLASLEACKLSVNFVNASKPMQKQKQKHIEVVADQKTTTPLRIEECPLILPIKADSITNHPNVAVAIVHFQKSGYSEAEIRHAFNSLEAGHVEGYWMWGTRRVGDWRAAMETRMYQDRKAGKSPTPASGEDMMKQVLQ